MADNYLEKRMDDYAKGRLSGRPSARRASGLKYPARTVLVVNAGCDKSRAVIKTLVDAGCKVAFTARDNKLGAAVAQQCGARFYPMALGAAVADMATRGECPDAVVIMGNDDVETTAASRIVRVVEEAAVDPSCVAVAGELLRESR